MLDSLYAYKFIRILTQEYTNMDLYKLGYIDAQGNILKSRKELSQNEKKNFTKFHILALNLRKIIEKFPFGKSSIARYSAAVKLLQEEISPLVKNQNLIEENLLEFLGEEVELYQNLSEESGILENFTSGIEMGDKPLGKFAGAIVFDCDPKRFMDCKMGKPKYHKYQYYVGDDELGEEIRQYGRKYPKHPIILRNSVDGSMLYLRK